MEVEMTITFAGIRTPLLLPVLSHEEFEKVLQDMPPVPTFVAPVRPSTPPIPQRPSLPFTPPPSPVPTLTRLFSVLQVEDTDPEEERKGAEAGGVTKK